MRTVATPPRAECNLEPSARFLTPNPRFFPPSSWQPGGVWRLVLVHKEEEEEHKEEEEDRVVVMVVLGFFEMR